MGHHYHTHRYNTHKLQESSWKRGGGNIAIYTVMGFLVKCIWQIWQCNYTHDLTEAGTAYIGSAKDQAS